MRNRQVQLSQDERLQLVLTQFGKPNELSGIRSNRLQHPKEYDIRSDVLIDGQKKFMTKPKALKASPEKFSRFMAEPAFSIFYNDTSFPKN